MKNSKLHKGFTLIELLVVIAVLAVLAAGVLVLIDPLDKISQGNDSKVQNDVGAAGRAAEAYAVTHSGYYPSALSDLTTAGELKYTPTAPSGYSAYSVSALPSNCAGGTTCTSFAVIGQLKSKRYTSASQSYFRYEAGTGQPPCYKSTAASTCP